MNKQFLKNRRAKYGGISVLLTILLLICVLLANALFGTLAARYGWTVDLHPVQTFPVGETSAVLINEALRFAENNVQIHFCDSPENLEQGSLVSYVYETAKQFSERDNRIEIVYHDILLDPESVGEYLTSTVIDTKTGTETTQTITLQKTSVIVTSGEKHRVYSIGEFFQYENGDSVPTAYAGEKKLTAAILRATALGAPVACLTNNHGEAYYDTELLSILDDAGYDLRGIDLTQSEIPSDCDLIVCFNPNKDLAAENGISAVSERKILDDFLAIPGHSLLVFLESGTPQLPEWDAYLSEWGISPCYAKDSETEYRYRVRDELGSLTSDGYTVLGKYSENELAEELMQNISQTPVFSGATGFRVASGFVPSANGSYQKGDRRVAVFYESGSGAVSYANGKAVDADPVGLIAYADQTVFGGTSRIGVICSVDFAAAEWLQPSAYGNAEILFRIFETTSGVRNVGHIPAVPFPSSVMHGLTRGARIGWTLLLVFAPAVIVASVAVPVLLRRKHD